MYMNWLLATCFIVQTTGLNRPAKFLILFKHLGYDNFELNWFHGLSKSRPIPFSRVSANQKQSGVLTVDRCFAAFCIFFVVISHYTISSAMCHPMYCLTATSKSTKAFKHPIIPTFCVLPSPSGQTSKKSIN